MVPTYFQFCTQFQTLDLLQSNLSCFGEDRNPTAFALAFDIQGEARLLCVGLRRRGGQSRFIFDGGSVKDESALSPNQYMFECVRGGVCARCGAISSAPTRGCATPSHPCSAGHRGEQWRPFFAVLSHASSKRSSASSRIASWRHAPEERCPCALCRYVYSEQDARRRSAIRRSCRVLTRSDQSVRMLCIQLKDVVY